MDKSKLFIRLISIYIYIVAIAGIIYPFIFSSQEGSKTRYILFLLSPIFSSIVDELNLLISVFIPYFLWYGLVFIILISLAYSLWKNYNWSRISVIIFSLLGIISYIPYMIYLTQPIFYDKPEVMEVIPRIIGTMIYLLILWCLGFNKNAKAFFSKNQKA